MLCPAQRCEQSVTAFVLAGFVGNFHVALTVKSSSNFLHLKRRGQRRRSCKCRVGSIIYQIQVPKVARTDRKAKIGVNSWGNYSQVIQCIM